MGLRVDRLVRLSGVASAVIMAIGLIRKVCALIVFLGFLAYYLAYYYGYSVRVDRFVRLIIIGGGLKGGVLKGRGLKGGGLKGRGFIYSILSCIIVKLSE